MPAYREVRLSLNPHAKPLGRKTPAQRAHEEPDLMAKARADRRNSFMDSPNRRPGTGFYVPDGTQYPKGYGFGPRLYGVVPDTSPLTVLAPLAPAPKKKS